MEGGGGVRVERRAAVQTRSGSGGVKNEPEHTSFNGVCTRVVDGGGGARCRVQGGGAGPRRLKKACVHSIERSWGGGSWRRCEGQPTHTEGSVRRAVVQAVVAGVENEPAHAPLSVRGVVEGGERARTHSIERARGGGGRRTREAPGVENKPAHAPFSARGGRGRRRREACARQWCGVAVALGVKNDPAHAALTVGRPYRAAAAPRAKNEPARRFGAVAAQGVKNEPVRGRCRVAMHGAGLACAVQGGSGAGHQENGRADGGVQRVHATFSPSKQVLSRSSHPEWGCPTGNEVHEGTSYPTQPADISRYKWKLFAVQHASPRYLGHQSGGVHVARVADGAGVHNPRRVLRCADVTSGNQREKSRRSTFDSHWLGRAGAYLFSAVVPIEIGLIFEINPLNGGFDFLNFRDLWCFVNPKLSPVNYGGV
ncbi:hypothetical protein GGX14DRAFT_390314 [Mycena pura]|uniref:Uncharacterized protein n=1 Tax=Mycena pura TaxID=153505 RepID=A0AAD6VP28_9AGAR|nr:hypothetical protein GGX14DRAFT_390314 [Mycena pura]